MEQYYLCISDQWFGPVSLDKIKDYPVSKDMLVWRPGFKEWVRADELNDKQPFVQTIPPPIKKVAKNLFSDEKNKHLNIRDVEDLIISYQGWSSFFVYTAVIVMLLVFIMIIGHFIYMILHNPENILILYGEWFFVFFCTCIVVYFARFYNKKSLELKEEISNYRSGKTDQINIINTLYNRRNGYFADQLRRRHYKVKL
jgi:hypothetical protein